MRAVVQRVKEVEVYVEGRSISKIGPGVLTLLGIEQGDDEARLAKMIEKICNLRIFEDPQGKMNLSVRDVQGSHLIVSQFTLLGDCSQGRRPSFIRAEKPDLARALYDKALVLSEEQGIETKGGIFQADMKVHLINDGPVTLVIDL